MVESRLPWTDRLTMLTPEQRASVLFAWEALPRIGDLTSPRSYLGGQRLWRTLHANGHTMLTPRRARNLYRLARWANRDRVPGALVDCGTWNGGSTALLAAGGGNRDVWAFDSFQGLPAPTSDDVGGRELTAEEIALVEGECLGSEDWLRRAVTEHAPDARLHVRAGWFQHTLPAAAREIGSIAVLHIDADWHDSVLIALRHLHPRVSPGGWVQVDDYGAVPGCRKAVDDYRRTLTAAPPLTRIDQTGVSWRVI